jgi:hypothetical protein
MVAKERNLKKSEVYDEYIKNKGKWYYEINSWTW